MAKTLARLKDRFMSKMRRPFYYKRARKNKDGLREPMVNNSETKTNCEASPCPKGKTASCSDWLKKESNCKNNNTEHSRIEKDLFSTEITETDDFQENGKVDFAEDDELSQTKLPMLERRRSSAFQRLRNWVKPESRRDAICEQMEREIEMRGVSLRQYRKFLATTYILYDLKML